MAVNKDELIKRIMGDNPGDRCVTHYPIWQSNCSACLRSGSVDFAFHDVLGKKLRAYLLKEMIAHPEQTEFQISIQSDDGAKLIIRPIDVDGETLDLDLFDRPQNWP